MGTLWQDLKYAARLLAKRPGFTAAVALTLALGIGANTTVFSVVNAVLLRPLPIPEPDRVVRVFETSRREVVERRPASYPDFVDWREQNTVFEHIAAFDSVAFTLTGGEEAVRVAGEMVSPSYFPLLGVQPVLGRTFLEEEDRGPSGSPVALVGHGLWQSRFGGRPDILGAAVKLSDRDYTIVGVMPQGFRGVTDDAELWVPFTSGAAARQMGPALERRGARWHDTIARLAPGVGVEAARREMDAIAGRLEQAFPDTNASRGVLLVAIGEETFGEIRPALLLLLGAVGFILLIACANVANLLLVRMTARRRESAIRAALGAGRWRLVRQYLAESLLLSLLGGALAAILSVWGVEALVAVSPVEFPSFVDASPDAKVLGFTLAVAALTGLVSGLTPALQAAGSDLTEALKEGARGLGSGARNRLRSGLVVAEIALAMLLLVGAGLVVRSLERIVAVDPGFDPENAVTVSVSLPARQYQSEAAAAFADRLLERARALPTVEAAAVASDVPLEGSTSAMFATVEGYVPASPADELRVYTHEVSPGFFAALGVPLKAGRDFGAGDTAGSPRVAVISEAMARRFWPNDDPVGKRLKPGRSTSEGEWLSIVGVVGDVKHRGLPDNPNGDPDVYTPFAQEPGTGFNLVLRTAGDPAAVYAALRKEIQALDADVPVYDMNPMSELVRRETARSRFSALLMSVFAALALALAAVGIYGVMSSAVAQRTHEIGVRMALGARRGDVIRIVVGQGMALTLAGVGVGLGLALALTRVMSGLLYGVSASDPLTYAGVAGVLAVVALAACLIPARRASRVDPMVALRYE
jgi:putative ABC transport system permease protein